MDLQTLILAVPAILIALTFHEYAHGYVAWRLGDPTARNMGRLTLNPLAHLDPMGTIMIFLVHFGWAKPVPVDPRYLGNPRRDLMWISAAGPLMNMVLALISGLLIRLFLASGVIQTHGSGIPGTLFLMLYFSLYINLALAVFNILPIPPLDGSKILAGVLPPRYSHIIYFLETNGPMLLFGIIMLGWFTNIRILGIIIGPFVRVFSKLFAGI